MIQNNNNSNEMATKMREPLWLGGAASVLASVCTHPLDTIKVQMQTTNQQQSTRHGGGLVSMSRHIVKTQGVAALFNGLSASMLRQATYSTTRFAVYEVLKQQQQQRQLLFYEKVLAAGVAGGVASVFGSPADICNIRMQNDAKLPADKRRNYRHVLDALCRIVRTEGASQLFVGFSATMLRGMLVTAGQLAVYDELKLRLMRTGHLADTMATHFLASIGAGFVATSITMPLDVIKTLLMNAKKNEFRGSFHCVSHVLVTSGPRRLVSGFWPRYMRLGPNTIIVFLIMENFKRYFI